MNRLTFMVAMVAADVLGAVILAKSVTAFLTPYLHEVQQALHFIYAR